MTIDLAVVVAFVLVLARTAAWVMTTPVFGSKGMSGLGRIALAMALSLFLAPLQARVAGDVPSDILPFMVVLLGQVMVGLALGWVTGLLLSAFEAAGAVIDISSGFGVGAIFDPLSGNHNSVFARFANLLFVTLLVATNAHTLLIGGFAKSFDAVPASTFPVLSGDSATAVVGAVSGLMVAALEIGAPVLGVLFLTEVVLAVAARMAPQANIFLVGLPLKIGVALAATSAALIYLPSHLEGLVDRSLRLGAGLFS